MLTWVTVAQITTTARRDCCMRIPSVYTDPGRALPYIPQRTFPRDKLSPADISPKMTAARHWSWAVNDAERGHVTDYMRGREVVGENAELAAITAKISEHKHPPRPPTHGTLYNSRRLFRSLSILFERSFQFFTTSVFVRKSIRRSISTARYRK